MDLPTLHDACRAASAPRVYAAPQIKVQKRPMPYLTRIPMQQTCKSAVLQFRGAVRRTTICRCAGFHVGPVLYLRLGRLGSISLAQRRYSAQPSACAGLPLLRPHTLVRRGKRPDTRPCWGSTLLSSFSGSRRSWNTAAPGRRRMGRPASPACRRTTADRQLKAARRLRLTASSASLVLCGRGTDRAGNSGCPATRRRAGRTGPP